MIASLLRTRVVSVCAGANHTLAISEAGQLWSCGRGRHGQLGHGHFHDEGTLTLVETIRGERIVSAAAGRAHSIALACDGKIFTWGDAKYGQLGHQQLVAMMQGPNPQPIAIPFPQPIVSLEPCKLKPPARITAVSAGGEHSMAVTVGGSVLAFGCNKHGQLGTGDRQDRMVPTEVLLTLESEQGQHVRGVQVQCGMQHTLLLVQNQGRMEVRATGNNSYGQLGLGDRDNRARFHPVNALKVGVVGVSVRMLRGPGLGSRRPSVTCLGATACPSWRLPVCLAGQTSWRVCHACLSLVPFRSSSSALDPVFSSLPAEGTRGVHQRGRLAQRGGVRRRRHLDLGPRRLRAAGPRRRQGTVEAQTAAGVQCHPP